MRKFLTMTNTCEEFWLPHDVLEFKGTYTLRVLAKLFYNRICVGSSVSDPRQLGPAGRLGPEN